MDARILLSLMWLVILSLVLSFRQNYSISTEKLLLFTLLHFALQLCFQQVTRKNFSSNKKSLPILKDYGSDFLFLRVSIRRSGLSGSPPIEWLLWSMSECLAISYSLPPHPLFSPLCPNWVKDNERAGHTIGWDLGLLGFACSSTACCSIISPPEPNPRPLPPDSLHLSSSPYHTSNKYTWWYTVHNTYCTWFQPSLSPTR